MNLNYFINKKEHKIKILRKPGEEIIQSIEKLKSDKKILFLFDSNINLKIVNTITDKLKINGSVIIKKKLNSNKINKNEKNLFIIINTLIENNFSRTSVIISLSGGVIGDLAALAASLYLRGLYYIHIPSTFTAIVDSCIGGKTAINYKGITNSIGNYYHPSNVFIYFNIIEDIPEREFLAGLPEIIKCGFVKKNNILYNLLNNKNKILKRDFKLLSEIILETLKTKIFFFKNDIYDRKQRKILNFGHTFAHAIEMTLDKKDKNFIRHGEAVGIGMICELYYSNKSLQLNKNLKLLIDLLTTYNLPTFIDLNKIKSNRIIKDDIFKNIFLDKKRNNKFPIYINIKKIYKPQIKEMTDYNFILEIINNIIK